MVTTLTCPDRETSRWPDQTMSRQLQYVGGSYANPLEELCLKDQSKLSA
jgi:hypothetical protein